MKKGEKGTASSSSFFFFFNFLLHHHWSSSSCCNFIRFHSFKVTLLLLCFHLGPFLLSTNTQHQTNIARSPPPQHKRTNKQANCLWPPNKPTKPTKPTKNQEKRRDDDETTQRDSHHTKKTKKTKKMTQHTLTHRIEKEQMSTKVSVLCTVGVGRGAACVSNI